MSYKTLYWNEWEKDVNTIDGNQGFVCFPPLCSVEGKNINKVTRGPVPIEELWRFHNGLRQTIIEGKQ